jgi:hypothetical protein
MGRAGEGEGKNAARLLLWAAKKTALVPNACVSAISAFGEQDAELPGQLVEEQAVEECIILLALGQRSAASRRAAPTASGWPAVGVGVAAPPAGFLLAGAQPRGGDGAPYTGQPPPSAMRTTATPWRACRMM